MERLAKREVVINVPKELNLLPKLIDRGEDTIYLNNDYYKHVLSISGYGNYIIFENITLATKSGKQVSYVKMEYKKEDEESIYNQITSALGVKGCSGEDFYNKLLQLEIYPSKFGTTISVKNAYNVFSPFVTTDLGINLDDLQGIKKGALGRSKLAKLIASNLDGDARLVYLTSDDASYDINKSFEDAIRVSTYNVAKDIYSGTLHYLGVKEDKDSISISVGTFSKKYIIKYDRKSDNKKQKTRKRERITNEDLIILSRMYKEFIQKLTKSSGRKINSVPNFNGKFSVIKYNKDIKIISEQKKIELLNNSNIKNKDITEIITSDKFILLTKKSYSNMKEFRDGVLKIISSV